MRRLQRRIFEISFRYKPDSRLDRDVRHGRRRRSSLCSNATSCGSLRWPTPIMACQKRLLCELLF